MARTSLEARPGYRHPVAQGLAWLLLLVGLVAAGAQFALQWQGCGMSAQPGSPGWFVSVVLASLAFAAIGRLLTARRPENRISWLLAWLGAATPTGFLLEVYSDCAVTRGLAWPGAALAAWLAPHLLLAAIALVYVFVPAWFPDGRFMTRRWAGALLAVVAVAALLSLGASLLPGTLNSGVSGPVPIQNPFGLPWAFLQQIEPLLIAGPPVVISLGILLAIVSFVQRFRGAVGETRQQFKWFALFLSTVVVVHILGFEIGGILFYPWIFNHWSYVVMITLSAGGFPVVIGLAIFKYRLYDIDLIIRRTLTYGALTALLALAYLAAVIVLQGVFVALTGEARSPLVTVASTLGIAALFNPLRRRVQDFIDRRFYRAKYDAEQALARFAAAARDEVDVDQLANALAAVVKETMQPEHISLWLRPGARRLPPEAR